jgi:hypothetical protein
MRCSWRLSLLILAVAVLVAFGAGFWLSLSVQKSPILASILPRPGPVVPVIVPDPPKGVPAVTQRQAIRAHGILKPQDALQSVDTPGTNLGPQTDKPVQPTQEPAGLAPGIYVVPLGGESAVTYSTGPGPPDTQPLTGEAIVTVAQDLTLSVDVSLDGIHTLAVRQDSLEIGVFGRGFVENLQPGLAVGGYARRDMGRGAWRWEAGIEYDGTKKYFASVTYEFALLSK